MLSPPVALQSGAVKFLDEIPLRLKIFVSPTNIPG
jgi:hypothetical protein